MKKILLFSLLVIGGSLRAYSYFADNTTPFPVKLKLIYDKTNPKCTSSDKVIAVPKSTVGVRIEDTVCCVDSVSAWRTDVQPTTNTIPESSSPSTRCGTNVFVIYANPNGTVSVTD